MEKLCFRKWINETEVVTGAHPKRKKSDTFNYWGAPGSTGKVIDGEVETNKNKKKKRKNNA